MKIDVLDEPELEFAGAAKHVDIRFGLMNAGPLDVLSPRTRTISLGFVGTTETLEGLTRWLERCRGEVPAKESHYPNLFPRFPGFRPDTGFRSTLLLESRSQRAIHQRDLAQVTKAPRSNRLVRAAVDLFLEEMRYLAENARPDVLVCAPPFDLMKVVKDDVVGEDDDQSEDNNVDGDPATESRYDFHDLLKARAMALHIPMQLIWPHTYDPSKRRQQKRRPERPRGQQDEATRAWNLHTALYYKAGGIPWRLVRDSTQLTTCCVGISFYKSLEGDRLLTSMAQVFNERGDGVVVRGGSASISRDDLQPHLDAVGADSLLAGALATYRKEHKNLPARIVLHKTSLYNEGERAGFRAAAERASVDQVDFLSVADSFTRLFRHGAHPPLRGTLLTLDGWNHVLYTKGSVDFFELYPGLYVPLPLLFRCDDTEQTPRFLAQELLALTKMNWNSTQFDGRDPITTRAAKQVGAILRYVGEADPVEPLYGFYM
jgi:hypothetical protein